MKFVLPKNIHKISLLHVSKYSEYIGERLENMDNMKNYREILNSLQPNALYKRSNLLNLNEEKINNEIDYLKDKRSELENRITHSKQCINDTLLQINNKRSFSSDAYSQIEMLQVKQTKSKNIQYKFIKISIIFFLFLCCLFVFQIKTLMIICIVAILISLSIIIYEGLSQKNCSASINNLIIQNENFDEDIRKYNNEIEKYEENIISNEYEINRIDSKLRDLEFDQAAIEIDIAQIKEKLDFLDNIENFNNHSSKLSKKEILNYIFFDPDLRNFYTALSKYFGKYSSYKANSEFITKNELKFYNELRFVAARKKLHIESKVKLADIIHIGEVENVSFHAEDSKKKTIDKYRYRINSKHIDFVLFDSNFNHVLSIEVDDPSHFDINKCTKEHIKSHITKDLVFSYCKMALLRIDDSKMGNLYNCVEKAINNKGVYYCYCEDNMKKFEETLDYFQNQ